MPPELLLRKIILTLVCQRFQGENVQGREVVQEAYLPWCFERLTLFFLQLLCCKSLRR